MRTLLLTLFISVIIDSQIQAQQKITPYNPTPAEMKEAYLRESKLDSILKTIPLNTNILPNWQDDGSYWYVKRLPNNQQEYFFVNVALLKKTVAFDCKRLAESITTITGTITDPNRLDITKMCFSADQNVVVFKTKKNWLTCDLKTYKSNLATDTDLKVYDNGKPLQAKHYRWESAPHDSISPDYQWVALGKAGNLYVKNIVSKKEIQLTTDGSLDKPYGEFSWSPDSRHIIGYLIDPKKIKQVYYVLSSVPGTTRGQLKSREYEQPGDEQTSYTPYIFNIANQQKIKVDTGKIDFFGTPVLHWRKDDSGYFLYEKVDRGHQRFRVIEVNVANGDIRNIIDEKTNTFIYEQRIYTRYLPASHEIVWITEKDGWRHIYLVNDKTGAQKLITKGNWVVRDIDSVDTQKREIWFTASGMNANEDPYFIHYYRIKFDGTHLVNLTPEIGNHHVVYSPNRKLFTDTYSQVNVAPVTLLRNTDSGKTLLTIENSDIIKLLTTTGLTLPEVFVAKARDQKTDIWGVVYRPSKFDQNKSYPIIENIYAGPQDSFVPKSFSPINEMQSLAELGFIVVQIDGMGTANRSKAFHDVCWKNLVDGGFADRILWMKALAKKYPQADTTRVGVYGTSAGGQNSAGAVLFHPEFYKAAVSACGCHDNRIDKQWWNEQWMGYPVGPHYEQQSNITNAGKLQGNLLLIVGEADENVPPESTYRFADALIKNNKNFDLLTVPGMGHSDGGPYGRRKKRDFFVKNLLNVDPPKRDIGEH